MFGKRADSGYEEILPGIRVKTLCAGERTLLSEFRMQKGSRLPEHSHPHEQTGYLVKGRVRLASGGLVKEASPGDSWSISGGQSHSAEILEDSIAIEVFSPMREEYLKYLREEDVAR